MKDIEYTIHSVPAALDAALRKRADDSGKSIEALIVEILDDAVKVPPKPQIYHDLDFMIGSWVEDPEFDAALMDFERIDPEEK